MGGLDSFDFEGDYITWTTDGANAGTVFERHGRFNCTNVCGTLKPINNQLNLTFYRHALDGATNWFVRHDINPKLMNGVMASIRIPKLPYQEQTLIATFLDRETAKIDRLIEKQQRLIELLEEKRQAVISHAVTKGLNPDVPMKDTGVEWLGSVPSSWDVSRFNYEIDYLEGPGILAKDFHDDGIPLLRIQNVKSEIVNNDFKTYLDPAMVQTKWQHFRVREGDLIISCSASTGLVSEVDVKTAGSIPYTGLIRLRPKNQKLTRDFIRLIVQSDMFFEQIKILQTGATIQHFGPAHLQQMSIVIPPVNEQYQVSEYVAELTVRLNSLISKANKAINLMSERRTALISAAVTGKIDVRNEVPQDVEEVVAS
jgi:type I restriction enzyme S subunit